MKMRVVLAMVRLLVVGMETILDLIFVISIHIEPQKAKKVKLAMGAVIISELDDAIAQEMTLMNIDVDFNAGYEHACGCGDGYSPGDGSKYASGSSYGYGPDFGSGEGCACGRADGRGTDNCTGYG